MTDDDRRTYDYVPPPRIQRELNRAYSRGWNDGCEYTKQGRLDAYAMGVLHTTVALLVVMLVVQIGRHLL